LKWYYILPAVLLLIIGGAPIEEDQPATATAKK